ncbi:hypothetical protein CAPTEDRAFT_198300 [Capitella teleta]|uniref:Histone deacetylase interacting domain-containing protein n=1 Tax=Capitella teleta TaxID=283909 RepID=R7UAG2_CAPTE|nr:hypothetical protein CAPTEDRAFT_198300 [Capitella teleta]|eukprot:ELU03116.1 hypothetical protein CAPTEDRAFT_198300 [Capitella teleta]
MEHKDEGDTQQKKTVDLANVDTAEAFVEKVEMQFGKDHQTYKDYVAAMQDWDNKEMTSDLLHTVVSYLFQEHPPLLEVFKSIVPLEEAQGGGPEKWPYDWEGTGRGT